MNPFIYQCNSKSQSKEDKICIDEKWDPSMSWKRDTTESQKNWERERGCWGKMERKKGHEAGRKYNHRHGAGQ